MPAIKRNPTDTIDLRREFADEFLASPQDHAEIIFDGEMEQLITEFDSELTAASKRWPSISYDAEWAKMDRWLSERGYVEPSA
jgi:hypothetical protein